MNNKKETPTRAIVGIYQSNEVCYVTINEPFGNLNTPFRVIFDRVHRYKDNDYYTKVDTIMDKSFHQELSFDEIKALIKADAFTTFWIIQDMIASGFLKKTLTIPAKRVPMLRPIKGGTLGIDAFGYVRYSSTMVSIARKYRLLTDKEKGGCE